MVRKNIWQLLYVIGARVTRWSEGRRGKTMKGKETPPVPQLTEHLGVGDVV